MSELRAPDPTLTAAETLVVVKFEQPVPVAHLLDDNDPYDGLRCDVPDDGADIPMATRHAAYIAVPCPTCFPGAPPPGGPREPWCGDPTCAVDHHLRLPHLAWQVS